MLTSILIAYHCIPQGVTVQHLYIPVQITIKWAFTKVPLITHYHFLNNKQCNFRMRIYMHFYSTASQDMLSLRQADTEIKNSTSSLYLSCSIIFKVNLFCCKRKAPPTLHSQQSVQTSAILTRPSNSGP